MSQNFDLLNQLEAEFEFGTTPTKSFFELSKTVDQTSLNSLGQKLLSLAQTIFLSEDPAPRQVVFCGVDTESGSGEICAELGRILATYSERPVCLVDADPRRPLFKLLRSGSQTLFSRLLPQECTEVASNLWLAEIDTQYPIRAGLSPVHKMRECIGDLRTRFEFALINAPGANARGDAGMLAQIADGVILIIEANSTRKAAAIKAKNTLQAMNARILGSVLNNRTYPIPERLYRRL
jgi:hypothetical protein